ncbi:uncharacterized protein T551_02654 [Pneumocystis jirovecii RU7]|uniref:Store-operated calcium entry-associated regulatory factor n=1 Tax=Pneumocystis jirovecii (strain RU7) TaxID=1408657 RepID=A0A0W4ZIN2_PNEJ7|nr:uncharacterized protein T551_02654 [Pneumocystis jirovecii RU7]KTW28235.1 hypothetical protein T551_02654 [Pneumocystis jirovecii RU7]
MLKIAPFLLLLVVVSCFQLNDRILLSKIRALTFYKEKYTRSLRFSPSPQIVCVGGDAKGLYEPSVIQCKNMGGDYDSEDIQWSCSSILPSYYRLGRTDVVCEGYDGSNSKYVLKGSCFVEYTLHLTEEGRMHYKNDIFSFFMSKNNINIWISFFLRFFFSFIVIYVICLLFKRFRISPQNWFPWNWFGGGGNGHPRGPPPPYSGPHYDKMYHSSRSIWTPGFWSGLLGGAALSYMMRGSRERYTHPNGMFYRHQFMGEEYRDNYRDMTDNTSAYTMRRSTGFGGTRRR